MSYKLNHVISFLFLAIFGLLLILFSISVYMNKYIYFDVTFYKIIAIMFIFVGISMIIFSSIFLTPKIINKIGRLNNGR